MRKDRLLDLNRFKLCISSLLLFVILTLYSFNAQAQNELLNLDMKNVPLNVLFEEIQKQSDWHFVYNNEQIAKLGKVSITVRNGSIRQVMSKVLENTGFFFYLENNLVVIRPNAEEVLPSLQKDKKVVMLSGTIVNKSKRPIPGVTVYIKGSNVGVSTDQNGKYSFKFIPTEHTIIVYSFVGMKTIERLYKNEKVIDLVMEDDMFQLNGVVVTGFNNVKNSSFTGNAVVIQKEDLLKASKTNVMKALQSFDPSFRIKENNRWGSDPNAMPEMYIRGESGMGDFDKVDKDLLEKSNLKDNPNLPTFIMDGFEISATTLYDMDPNRIESITILKDAAATALYGSRAANGVVVITTVTPKPGKLNVSYNFVGDVTVPDLSDYHLLNAAEKLELERKVGFYDIKNSDGYTSEFDLQNEYYKKLANVKEGVDTYWLSKPLTTVFNHKHSIYVDGGSQNLRFGIDMQYANQDGVMKGSCRNKIGAGAYIQYNLNNVVVKNYVSWNQTKSEDSPYGNFADFANQLPYDKYADENGHFYEKLTYWGDNSPMNKFNPMYEPSLHSFSKQKREELIDNLSINWRIIPSLLFKGQLSFTKSTDKSDKFIDPLSQRKENIFPMNSKNISSGTYYLNNGDLYSIDLSATLSYNANIKDHAINALVGFNLRESKNEYNSITYVGFPSGLLSSPMYAQRVYEKGSFQDDKNRLLGFLGTVNYSYKNIYLLDASVRIDGSSNFGSDKRFASFWSAGAGLNIHNFKFMENITWISMLKIRGSYGQTGKANFPPYDARTSYEIITDEWYKTGYGAALMALGNKKLTWETTNTTDIGAEISLFNDMFYFKGSYYNRTTVDLITAMTVPLSTGFMSYKDNVGEISNRGYELDMRLNPLRLEDWSLIINANLAHNKNRIEKISNTMKAYNERVQNMYKKFLVDGDPEKTKQTMPFLQFEEGGSMSSIYGVRSLGINPATGEEVFLSRTGDVAKNWKTSDQIALGTTEPKAQGSFGFNLTWKRLSIYTSFLYEFGGQRYNQTLVDKVENVNVYANNVDNRVLKERWMKPGDKAKYKKISTDRVRPNYTKPTSRFVQDYNSLALSSVELGYDMPYKYLEKLKLNMLRFTIGMNDIMHLQSVKMERGTSYPFARTINFSIKVSL